MRRYCCIMGVWVKSLFLMMGVSNTQPAVENLRPSRRARAAILTRPPWPARSVRGRPGYRSDLNTPIAGARGGLLLGFQLAQLGLLVFDLGAKLVLRDLAARATRQQRSKRARLPFA